jgi:Na+-driven multidrug efflux pump
MLPALVHMALWFIMPVGGLVWLGGAVLVATVLAVTDHSPVAAEITRGAFLGLIILVILTILGFANLQ